METQFNEEFVYRAVQSGELEIDSEGQVWRVMRKRSDNVNRTHTLVPCERKRAESANGRYLQVKTTIDGVRKYAAAHRLVWRHFHGPIPAGKTVNHIDGLTTLNRPSNLELATSQEQTAHAYTVLGRKRAGPAGESNVHTTLRDSDVMEIRRLAADGETHKALAERYGLDRSSIAKIVSRRSWKHVP